MKLSSTALPAAAIAILASASGAGASDYLEATITWARENEHVGTMVAVVAGVFVVGLFSMIAREPKRKSAQVMQYEAEIAQFSASLRGHSRRR